MRSHARSLFSMAVMLLSCAAPASADPITATYNVHVTELMTWQSNPNWLPFEQDFTLLLTFDPALSTGPKSYGPAWFSAVPLPTVASPPGLSLTTQRFTLHGTFPENEVDPLNLFATATVHETGLSPDWNYFRLTRLITNIATGDPPPAFTPDTFPEHLVLGSPFNFDYGSDLFRMTPTISVVDSLSFRGFAILVGVGPVPEPATVFLVGSGLVLLARSRRRPHRNG